MGEFSFVIASEALDEGVFDTRINEAVLSAVLLSIIASPFLFFARERFAGLMRQVTADGDAFGGPRRAVHR